MRDISARGSQHVDEEVGGWGRCSARSVSRYGHGTDHLVDYLQGSQKKERLDDVNLQRQVQPLCHAAEPDGQRKDRVEAGGTQQSISDGGGGTESSRWVDLGSEKTTGGGACVTAQGETITSVIVKRVKRV